MKERILIVGKRGGILQWYEHLLAAQNQLPEFEITGFALNHNHFAERAKKTIAGAFNKPLKEKITAKALDKKLTSFRPNLILITDLFYLSEDIIKVIRKHKDTTKVVHWIGDFFDDRLTKTSAITDQYYFTDSGLLEDAIKMGLTQSSYLPLAFNPDLFKRSEQEARINDLLFIGAWSKNREYLIRQIKQPMTVVGKGWDKIKDTHHNVMGKNISNEQVAKLYQQHACVLNIINSGNITKGLNMRCFEAPACGSLLITDNVKDLPLCYNTETEVVPYNNANDLSEIYDQLRQAPSKLASLSSNGHARATKQHTYADRIKSVTSIS